MIERLAHRSDEELNRPVGSLAEGEQVAIAPSLARLDKALAAAP